MERVAAGLLDQPERAASALVRQEPAWRSVRAGAPDRPTWVRIDLDAIGHNVRRLRAIAGVPLMVTLKADAYGHGAVRVARTALANGATALAVATLGEARALREAGIAAPILVFGYTPPWQAREAVALGLTCTIFDLDSARALADAADALEREAIVHVKVDTGMARLGLPPDAGRRVSSGAARDARACGWKGCTPISPPPTAPTKHLRALQLRRFEQRAGRDHGGGAAAAAGPRRE